MKPYIPLFEKFVDAGKNLYTGHGDDYAKYVEIFKNPDQDEMKEIMPEARGFITENGDLYLCHQEINGNWKEVIIHFGIRQLLRSKGLLKGYSIEVQRLQDSNRILLGESEESSKTFIEEVFYKAMEKNPTLEFINDRITSEI